MNKKHFTVTALILGFFAYFQAGLIHAIPLPTLITLENRVYVPEGHLSSATISVQGDSYNIPAHSRKISIVPTNKSIQINLESMMFDFLPMNSNKFQNCHIAAELTKGDIMGVLVTGVAPFGPIMCYSLITHI